MADTGYINGSNLLLKVGGKCIDKCSTHSVSLGVETKERAVKPLASKTKSSGVFAEKGATKLTAQISGEGYRYDGEEENGFKALAKLYYAHESIDVECFERESDTTPYLKGKFIITSLEETSPAQDDATYSIQLENDGEFELYPTTE